MTRPAWSDYTDWATVCKRAAGRNHINSLRREAAQRRQRQVSELLGVYGFGHGSLAQIARRLGVHRSTISRDVAVLLAGARAKREADAQAAARYPDPFADEEFA